MPLSLYLGRPLGPRYYRTMSVCGMPLLRQSLRDRTSNSLRYKVFRIVYCPCPTYLVPTLSVSFLEFFIHITHTACKIVYDVCLMCTVRGLHSKTVPLHQKKTVGYRSLTDTVCTVYYVLDTELYRVPYYSVYLPASSYYVPYYRTCTEVPVLLVRTVQVPTYRTYLLYSTVLT